VEEVFIRSAVARSRLGVKAENFSHHGRPCEAERMPVRTLKNRDPGTLSSSSQKVPTLRKNKRREALPSQPTHDQSAADVRPFGSNLARLSRLPAAGGQHSYQQFAFAAHRVEGFAPRLATTMTAGVLRLRLSVPGQLRLTRFRCKTKLKELKSEVLRAVKNRRSMARALSLVLLFGFTAACSLVSGDGSHKSGFSFGPMPELSKKRPAVDPAARRPNAPWTYVLSVDHGVRADQSGQGYFRAPRFHGEHNGLDLLAPVGTPVFAPCSGKVMAGASPSFGHWVHLICPVPDSFVAEGQPHPWVSFFYAHLRQTEFTPNEWLDVNAADQVGEVGKSGNAQDANIQPHLHLELIVQRNRRAAMDERHLGADQSSVAAAEHFASVLSQECMARYRFESKISQVQRARRIDPFIALTCLSDFKPNFKKAPSPLTGASRDWAQFYAAKDFNVNLGVEDSALARH